MHMNSNRLQIDAHEFQTVLGSKPKTSFLDLLMSSMDPWNTRESKLEST